MWCTLFVVGTCTAAMLYRIQHAPALLKITKEHTVCLSIVYIYIYLWSASLCIHSFPVQAEVTLKIKRLNWHNEEQFQTVSIYVQVQ